MKITLTNNFHNTETLVHSTKLSPATMRRVYRALCGISDCKCGGIRGRQKQVLEVEPHQDGSATLILRS